MSWKLRVLVSTMLLVPPVALPLGLGEIRLGSALNEPLSAEIDLVAATPEELGALTAQLASPELFRRYGMDRPAYLDALEFRVGRGRDGRSVLLVRSNQAIGEPFVSFLVDVTWPRGHLLREYTVLLDPPVFAPQDDQAAPAAIVAPRTESAPARPAAAAAAAPSEAPAAQSASSSDNPSAQSPSAYRVERGDTLYKIAGGMAAGDHATTQRMMIGIFRSNPEDANHHPLCRRAITGCHAAGNLVKRVTALDAVCRWALRRRIFTGRRGLSGSLPLGKGRLRRFLRNR